MHHAENRLNITNYLLMEFAIFNAFGLIDNYYSKTTLQYFDLQKKEDITRPFILYTRIWRAKIRSAVPGEEIEHYYYVELRLNVVLRMYSVSHYYSTFSRSSIIECIIILCVVSANDK